jgi:DNA-binding NtrC family response regulator
MSAPPEERAAPPAPGAAHPGGIILVIEDDDTVRWVTQRVLERSGFRVLLARDGPEGMDLFRGRGPEIVLVILDLTLPHLGGEEVFRQLRLQRPDVRVLLMSGYQELAGANPLAGQGLAEFLPKPFRMEDLLTAVRRALEPLP